MTRDDIVPAVVLLGLSAAILLETRGLEFYGETTPGPAFLPVWLAVAGATLFVLRLIEARRRPAIGIDWPDRAGLARVVQILAGLIAVPTLAPMLGLVLTLLLFMAYLLLVVLRQRPVPSLIATALTGGIIYGIFVLWLGVALPRGILGF